MGNGEWGMRNGADDERTLGPDLEDKVTLFDAERRLASVEDGAGRVKRDIGARTDIKKHILKI